jgi:hypothetical protein
MGGANRPWATARTRPGNAPDGPATHEPGRRTAGCWHADGQLASQVSGPGSRTRRWRLGVQMPGWLARMAGVAAPLARAQGVCRRPATGGASSLPRPHLCAGCVSPDAGVGGIRHQRLYWELRCARSGFRTGVTANVTCAANTPLRDVAHDPTACQTTPAERITHCRRHPSRSGQRTIAAPRMPASSRLQLQRRPVDTTRQRPVPSHSAAFELPARTARHRCRQSLELDGRIVDKGASHAQRGGAAQIDRD